MELHERLKLARERKYETAQAASDTLGIPYGTLTNHEAGDRTPRDRTLRQYADAYKVRIEWLRYEEGPMTEEQSREIQAIVAELNQFPASELARARDVLRTLRRHSR